MNENGSFLWGYQLRMSEEINDNHSAKENLLSTKYRAYSLLAGGIQRVSIHENAIFGFPFLTLYPYIVHPVSFYTFPAK